MTAFLKTTSVFRRLTPLVLTCAIAACDEAPVETDNSISRPVKIFTVGQSGAGRAVEYPGSVSAAQQSEMAFEVPGRIVEVLVTEGAPVEEGAVLARLDPRDYESARARAQAERDAAVADFERYDEAYKANAVTAQDVDRARRNLQVAEANLQSAVKAVQDTELRAPFSGRVARKLVEDFANVQAKQTVLVLQSDGALEMKINVPESDWARSRPMRDVDDVNSDLTTRVKISSLPGQEIPARISAFSSSADPVTRTFEVTVEFDRPDSINISPGMTGHVVVDVPPEIAITGLLVPANAVAANAENEPYVWLIAQGSNVVQQQRVQVGELTGDSIRILDGLGDGDRIAVSGVHTLTDGMLVHSLGD